ncbi:protein of unknown function [Tenacibaculum sp. 190524A02b]|uniref:hypothetical protein n=1 Tax=Tenacibaculum vairaonense TaxID=3137860 RepID=UPI0032B2ED2B
MLRYIVNIKDRKKYVLNNEKLKDKCNIEKNQMKDNNRLINHLEKAEFLNIVLDKSVCIFSGEYINHYQTIRTDGLWVWSSDLLHYTKNYNFQWPKDFVKHVNSNIGVTNNINEEHFTFLNKNFSYCALEKQNISLIQVE